MPKSKRTLKRRLQVRARQRQARQRPVREDRRLNPTSLVPPARVRELAERLAAE